MIFNWVIARYKTNDDRGKYVLSLVNEGIGYFLLNKDRQRSEDIIVAFKKPSDGEPLPHHLAFATEDQIKKLNLMDDKRRGASKKVVMGRSPVKVSNMFPSKN